MKNSNIKKFIKLSNMLENELIDIYLEVIYEMFPNIDNRRFPRVVKSSIIHEMHQKIISKYDALKDSKFIVKIIETVIDNQREVRHHDNSSLQRLRK